MCTEQAWCHCLVTGGVARPTLSVLCAQAREKLTLRPRPRNTSKLERIGTSGRFSSARHAFAILRPIFRNLNFRHLLQAQVKMGMLRPAVFLRRRAPRRQAHHRRVPRGTLRPQGQSGIPRVERRCSNTSMSNAVGIGRSCVVMGTQSSRI